jgi:L-threonylcarbamoyladenylate synthase
MIVADSQQTREDAARVIADGGIIAFRTDTFYGLGADPLNHKAITAIRVLKGREEGKPILLLISDLNELQRFIGDRLPIFDAVAKSYWPGPLTLIGPSRPELPQELTAGTGTIGVRLPDDEGVRALVRVCGGALTATSANFAGSPPACTATEVQHYFQTGLALIIDGGEATASQPSTVMDLSGPEPRLIREGAITREELRKTMDEVTGDR